MIKVGQEPPAMLTDEEKERKAIKPSKAKVKGKERFALLNAFVDFSMGELSRAEILVWMILYRDSKEGVASTAQADIARRGKVSRRTVGRSLRRLASWDLLTIVRQGGFRQGVSSYRVHGLMADPGGT